MTTCNNCAQTIVTKSTTNVNYEINKRDRFNQIGKITEANICIKGTITLGHNYRGSIDGRGEEMKEAGWDHSRTTTVGSQKVKPQGSRVNIFCRIF